MKDASIITHRRLLTCEHVDLKQEGKELAVETINQFVAPVSPLKENIFGYGEGYRYQVGPPKRQSDPEVRFELDRHCVSPPLGKVLKAW